MNATIHYNEHGTDPCFRTLAECVSFWEARGYTVAVAGAHPDQTGSAFYVVKD